MITCKRLRAFGCSLQDRDHPYLGFPNPNEDETAHARECREGERPLQAIDFGRLATERMQEKDARAAIKKLLCKYGPVAAEIQMETALPEALLGYQPLDFYAGGIFDYQCQNRDASINHLVCITGWDDTRGAWQIKNSKGKDWGDHGFAWVKYGACQIGYMVFWLKAMTRSSQGLSPAVQELIEELHEDIKQHPIVPSPAPVPPFPPCPPVPKCK